VHEGLNNVDSHIIVEYEKACDNGTFGLMYCTNAMHLYSLHKANNDNEKTSKIYISVYVTSNNTQCFLRFHFN